MSKDDLTEQFRRCVAASLLFEAHGPRHTLADGRVASVQPVLYGRARVTVHRPGRMSDNDAW